MICCHFILFGLIQRPIQACSRKLLREIKISKFTNLTVYIERQNFLIMPIFTVCISCISTFRVNQKNIILSLLSSTIQISSFFLIRLISSPSEDLIRMCVNLFAQFRVDYTFKTQIFYLVQNLDKNHDFEILRKKPGYFSKLNS